MFHFRRLYPKWVAGDRCDLATVASATG